MNKDINKKRKFIVAVLFFALLIPQISIADDLKLDIQASFFDLKSGSGEKFTRDNIMGKVIILFYETKGAKEKNRKAKDELNIFYEQQEEWVKELVMRLPVINWGFTTFADRFVAFSEIPSTNVAHISY